MFSMGDSKAQTAEDVLDNSSKTMSIKERYLNFSFFFLMIPINTVIILMMVIKEALKLFLKELSGDY